MYQKQYFVYIVTNKINTVLYTVVTNDLIRRAFQYKSGTGSKFASKYNLDKLVYYEIFDDIKEAISREKQIKGGSRKKKLDLINKSNPKWIDLYPDIVK